MRQALLFLFVLFFSCVSAQSDSTKTTAREGEDIVALADGIILRGKIISQQSGTMIFKDNVSGELKIKNSRIAWSMKVFPGKNYRIITNGSVSYFGKLITADEQALQLETSASGKVAIPFSSIKSVEIFSGDLKVTPVDGSEGNTDPLLAHYVFTPSAIPVKRDELYYNNSMLLCNSIHYSITDHIGIGGGLVTFVFPYIYGRAGTQVGERSYLGGLAIIGGSVLETDFGLGLGGLGIYTYGSEERNISVAAGYGGVTNRYSNFVNGTSGYRWETPDKPVIMVSGMARAGRRATLITENWIFPDFFSNGDISSIHMLGLRIKGERGAIDFGLSGSGLWWGNGLYILIPFGSYTYKF